MLLPILLLNAAATAALATAETPLLDGATSKSVTEFGQCFVSAQHSLARPVSLVPYEDGVRISNEGATGVTNPYRIRFTEAASGNRIQVLIGRPNSPEVQPLVKGVKGCW